MATASMASSASGRLAAMMIAIGSPTYDDFAVGENRPVRL